MKKKLPQICDKKNNFKKIATEYIAKNRNERIASNGWGK